MTMIGLDGMNVRGARITQYAFTDAVVGEHQPQTEGGTVAVDETTRRFAARRASATPGGILVDAVSPPIPCVIRNTSSTGALLELKTSLGTWSHTAADLPDDFVLVMNAEYLAFDCVVARRVGRQVGVRFSGPARQMARPRPQATPKPVPEGARSVRGALPTFGRRG